MEEITYEIYRDGASDLKGHLQASIRAFYERHGCLRFSLNLQPQGSDYAAHIRLSGEAVPFIPATIGNVESVMARLPRHTKVTASLPVLARV